MDVEFSAFFEEVWERPPFPWQVRLFKRVAADGWPSVLDLPTGVGKTSALDVALFHLATDETRRAPRRIVLVVDRRIIVDQVAHHARRLRRAIETKSGPAARAVADRLAELVGSDAPLLETAVLRGASLRDDTWAKYPQVPVLAASTVDQVGSRLLFRGYGVSDGMKPIHAGLMGCDTLLLLDEVHLSRPFADVLEQLHRLRGDEGEVPRRFRVVELSATPGTHADDTFRLDGADRDHSVLARRLAARKPVTLDSVKVRAKDDEADKRRILAERAAEHARGMIEEGRSAVAVVVNRVDTARRVWRSLRSEVFDCILLTGRMRPLDQQTTIERVEDRVLADRPDDEAAKPLVLVATQCIEAGADFDFDAMVSECASVDALRQRFGRVDRRGERDARGVILMRSDQTNAPDDPVYGPAMGRTWNWLKELDASHGIDFGVDALAPHLDALEEKLDELRAPSREAPVLMAPYLDQWVQTNPPPHADPDVSLFLHGIPDVGWSTVPDVQVVWRADVTQAEIDRAHREKGDAASLLFERLQPTAPGALEALSLPVWIVRAWLTDGAQSRTDEDIADVVGQRVEEGARPRSTTAVVVWRGRRNAEVVAASDIPPGALIVVPAERGGLGPHGSFEPDNAYEDAPAQPVADLGDAVQLLQRGTPSLRLDVRVMGRWMDGEFADTFTNTDDDTVDARARVREVVNEILAAHVDDEPNWLSALRAAINEQKSQLRYVRTTYDEMPRWLVLGRPLTREKLDALLGDPSMDADLFSGDTTTEGEDGSFIGASSKLVAHLEGVGVLAAQFARACGLSDELIAALRWSGRIHDAGKVDSRFQLWLYGGDEVAASIGDVLAKSAVPRQDAGARRRARERAGYPRGQRHELVSLDMAESSEPLRERVETDGADWDLVLHLVASHHGWCRAVAPAVVIEESIAQHVSWEIDGLTISGTTKHERGRMNSGVTDRFWRLVRRYGWHELAYLEAILRLADHRRSAAEQLGTT